MSREPLHPNESWDGPKETTDGLRSLQHPFYPSHYLPNDDHSAQFEASSSRSSARYDVAELFRDAVDNARQSIQQSLAGSEKVGEAVKPKLTIDLSHRSIEDMTDDVVDILKRDVERLQLAHNQLWYIPYRFADCTPLKYLNLRGNRFKEFPKAVCKLPQLEILDLSRNKLSRIPEDIKTMKTLRVLSLLNNNLGDIPSFVGSLEALRILKITGNPLKPNLKRIVEGNDGSSSPSLTTLADNEKDAHLTKKIKKYLKSEVVSKESGEESSSDGPLDTPRPLKRNLSLRFPVKPSTLGSGSNPDTRSPNFNKPPIPTRSHYRVTSSQNDSFQHAALRRPGVAPLATGNERNRSNSESILPATHNNRSKRMGMVTKKNTNFGAFDESRTNRNSMHFRGQSYGSALRDAHSNLTRGNGDNVPASPIEYERHRGTFVRRLSSLPEYKRESKSFDSVVEGAKGVLYSLHQVHQHILNLIHVVKDGSSKRSSLERVYHNASSQLEHLDQELHIFDSCEGEEEKARSNNTITYACSACIVAYKQVGSLLLRNIPQLVKNAEPRYLRTLILLLYGSLVEARNACHGLGINLDLAKPQKPTTNGIPTIREEGPKQRDRSITPTRERPNPERRWRNGNLFMPPGSLNIYNPAAGSQGAVPLYVNGRSRSNSRTAGMNGSTTSSVANTPRSGESFTVPGTPLARSRSNSAVAVAHGTYLKYISTPEDLDREVLFEKIFLCLRTSVEQGRQALPVVLERFTRCLKNSQSNSSSSRSIRDLWSELVGRSQLCLEICDVLKIRLSSIKLHEPTARNARDFWKLCFRYIDAVVHLLTGIRSAKHVELVHTDVVRIVRPMHTAAREALSEIKDSPWARLMIEHPPPAAPPSANGPFRHHRNLNHSSGSGAGAGAGASQFLPKAPPTPLSAALGPAAQATMSSTPGSASAGASAPLDRSFQGSVFQRPDALLPSQQTMVYRH